MLANASGWRILDAVNNRRFAVISDAVNRAAPRIVTAIEDPPSSSTGRFV